MLGFSLYFDRDFYIEDEIDKHKDFDLLFTSLHYPVDEMVFEKFLGLYEKAKDADIKICADINSQTLADHKELLDMDIIIRLDFGFAMEEIAELSKNHKLAINASTVTYNQLEDLEANQANLVNIIGIHNYYPLEFSGLALDYFDKQNQMLEAVGIEVFAFVPGNDRLRGPLYKGLPTLEDQRGTNPYLAYVRMARDFGMDNIILAEGLVDKDLTYIEKFANDGIISLPSLLASDLDPIRIRQEVSDYIIRNEREKKDVPPGGSIDVETGDILICNNNLGRYAGEIEIVKRPLGSLNDRNILGKVADDYVEIIYMIKGGDKIEFDRR